MARLQFWLAVHALLAVAFGALAHPVSAQSENRFSLQVPGEMLLALAGPGPASNPATSASLSDEQALEEERAPREEFRESTDPYEDPKRRYVFLGAGWRFVRLPSWLLKAYQVESGPSVGTPSAVFGELAFRRKGFQVLADAGFVKWNFHGPFQLKGDPIEDTEWLQGNLKFLMLSTAITWSSSFTDWFQLEYGLEAGLGFVFGDVIRNEAVKRADGKWGKCSTWASQSSNPASLLYNSMSPDPTPEEQRYCDIPDGPDNARPPPTNAADEDGAHYGVKAKRGLLNGGGIPRLVPLIGPRVSLRFKPIHQLVLRVDVPLPVLPFGFVGGVSAQYGF